MGTDCHFIVQIRDHDGLGWHQLAGDDLIRRMPRCYPLFSVLSNIANRAGHFAPHMMPVTVEGEEYEVNYDPDNGGHESLIPIADPRGVPEDAPEFWRDFVREWAERAPETRASWVTAREALAAQWDQTVYRDSCVPEEVYVKYLNDGTLPQVFGETLEVNGNKIVNELEYASGVRGERSTFIRMGWREGPVRSCCKVTQDFVDLLEQLGADGTPDIRFLLLFEC